MTHPDQCRLTAKAVLCAGLLVGVVALAGCGEDEPQQAAAPPPPPAAPPPPPEPSVTPVEQLMAQYSIDERIVLPEQRAPESNADRIAVLEFFDAFARGDVAALSMMMTPVDQEELEELVVSGSWEETIEDIERVDLRTGKSPLGDKTVIAVFQVGDTFQPQMWYYKSGGQTVFESQPSPPGMMDQLYGSDWIGIWHQILQQEMELANKPDEDWDPQRVVIDDGEDEESSSAGSPGGTPGAKPGGPPGRRPPPPGGPRRPPGAR